MKHSNSRPVAWGRGLRRRVKGTRGEKKRGKIKGKGVSMDSESSLISWRVEEVIPMRVLRRSLAFSSLFYTVTESLSDD